jgi:hypothetical protein
MLSSRRLSLLFVDGFDDQQLGELALDPDELMYFCSKPVASGS